MKHTPKPKGGNNVHLLPRKEKKMKEKIVYTVHVLEDGVLTYDCNLCNVSALCSIDMERHILDHMIEDHSSDVCSDLKNHELHFVWGR